MRLVLLPKKKFFFDEQKGYFFLDSYKSTKVKSNFSFLQMYQTISRTRIINFHS